MLRHFLFGLSPSHRCIIRIYSIPLGAYKDPPLGGSFIVDPYQTVCVTRWRAGGGRFIDALPATPNQS